MYISKIKQITKQIPFANQIYRFYIESKSRLKLLKISKQNIIKIELGSGVKKGINGWTTIDFFGADVNLDLRKGLFIPNRSVDEFFASHFLEHLDISELQNFIKISFEKLKLGGKFLIAVPDASVFIEAYNSRTNLIQSLKFFHEKSYVNTYSNIDQINYIAYMNGEHKYMFDKENLVNLFTQAGFRECKLREFAPGLDTEAHKEHSIYAVAIK